MHVHGIRAGYKATIYLFTVRPQIADRTQMQMKMVLLSCLLVALLAAGTQLPARDAPGGSCRETQTRESATWRLEFDNDIFFRSDDGISNGLSLQYHSPAAADWPDLKGICRLQRRMGKRLPFPGREGMRCRAGLAIGQLIQTPLDITRSDLIPEDVPYAGALTLHANWIRFSDDDLYGFEVVTGVAGPLSLAGATQRLIHRLFGFRPPCGWDQQLGNELLLNFNSVRKKKIWSAGRAEGAAIDLAICGDVALGNLLTHARAALELRAGRNLPGGFISLPDPGGFSMQHAAVLDPACPARASWQGFFVLRGTALGRMLFLDGNTFRHSHRLERNSFMVQALTGLRFDHGRWGVGFFVMSSTPVVKGAKVPSTAGGEPLGAIQLEWRI